MKKMIKLLLKKLRIFRLSLKIAYHLFGYNSSYFQQKEKMKKFYSQFIKAGDICFDVGANLGHRTEVFSELKSKVISIEPQTVCLTELYDRFEYDRNVIIVPKGLAEKEGFAELFVCEEGSWISTMSEQWKTESRFAKSSEWKGKEIVPITTLDMLIGEYGLPKFCKIDVEGFEEKVLSGATQPIPCLSFEYNQEFSYLAKNCVNILSNLANYKFNFSEGESMEMVFPEWISSEHLFNRLAQVSVNNQTLWGDIYARIINE